MPDTKDKRIAEARKQLETATRQSDEAYTASWMPTDPAECISKCFYAFENAVVAAVMALGIPWEKNHRKKADLAATLFDTGKVALLHDSTAARVGALFQLLVQDTTAQDFGLPSSAIRLRM